MIAHFATAPFSIGIFDERIIQHMYLFVLSENLKRCFAFLENATLSPSIRKVIGWTLSPPGTVRRCEI